MCQAEKFGGFNVLAEQQKHETFGAAEKTRTSTPVKEQRPQRCASTNSATAAREVGSV